MSRRKHIFGLGLLLAAATTIPAYAQPASVTQAQLASDYPACTKTTINANDGELAKQKFIAARQDYEEGNYDSALRRFKDAYNLDCTKPELLLIVSATYERKGDKPSALAALETYVARAPKDAPDMTTTQAKIDNLKKQIASAPPPTTSSPAAATEEQGHTIYPWVLVGGGVLVATVGIVLFATAPNVPGDCNKVTGKCTQPTGENRQDFLDDQSRAGNAVGQPIWGGVMIGVGSAMVLGGIIWHFVEPTGPKEKTTGSFTPSLGPGFAGLSYKSAFF